VLLLLPLSPHEGNIRKVFILGSHPPIPLLDDASNDSIVVPTTNIELGTHLHLLILVELLDHLFHVVGFVDCSEESRVHPRFDKGQELPRLEVLSYLRLTFEFLRNLDVKVLQCLMDLLQLKVFYRLAGWSHRRLLKDDIFIRLEDQLHNMIDLANS